MPFPIVPAALGLTQLLGGILGRPRGIDMAAWERMFGPQALQALTNQYMQQFQNSPFARQQQLNAANTGQQVANQYAAMPGARTSGVGQVSQSLAGGATNSLQQALMAMLFQQAMGAAQNTLGQKSDIFLHNQQQPSFWQQFGPALTGAASQTLSMLPTGTSGGSNPLAGFNSAVEQGATPDFKSMYKPPDFSFFDQFSNRAVGAR